jgi:2',3'-cyclic-nucleotide 2'-phosphodiesterase/3'-nucleotidase
VLFSTGPKARDFVGDVKGVAIEPAGEGADGFALYRIKL